VGAYKVHPGVVVRRLIVRLWKETSGQDLTEYTLLLFFVVLLLAAVTGTVTLGSGPTLLQAAQFTLGLGLLAGALWLLYELFAK
jgi:Flp pilus assembly pilin Flp